MNRDALDVQIKFFELSRIKKTLDEIKCGMLKGDIPCYGEENPYGMTFYEDAIACTLSNVVESGKISEDEYEAIYNLYVN
jgi:hypothetical protein